VSAAPPSAVCFKNWRRGRRMRSVMAAAPTVKTGSRTLAARN